MEPGYFRFICIHDQCPAVIKELSSGLSTAALSAVDEGQLKVNLGVYLSSNLLSMEDPVL